MMLGMRLSYSQLSTLKRRIKKEDFHMEVKIVLPESNNVFFDYAPRVFESIRNIFKISFDDYFLSIGPEQVLGNLILGRMSSLSEKISDGKSGSFFFYSHDGRFMVKTIPTK